MRSNVRSLAAAFTVGMVGWLAVAFLQLTGELVFFAAFLVGAIAGTLTRRPAAIVGLVAGMLAAYPIALLGKLIVYLGESWAIYVSLASGLAVAGFFAARLASQGRRSMSAVDSGGTPQSHGIARR